MITIKDNSGRANAVKIIFYIMMGLDIVSAYSNIMQYRLIRDMQSGAIISPQTIEANDSRQQLIGIIQMLLIIATIVSFIMWSSRAYRNLHSLNINLQYTPGWAAGSWFVPFVNLGRPYTIMREIWEETQTFFLPKEEKFLVSSAALVGWWWGFWLGQNIIANISSRMLLSAKDAGDFLSATSFSLFSDVTDMISMIITLIMVMRMSEYETRLAQHVEQLNNMPPAEPAGPEPVTVIS